MRDRLPILLLALGLALAGGQGCFVDEIDKSMAAYENKPMPAPAPPPAAGEPAPTGAAPAAPAGPSWWQTARTLGSEPMDDTIAACEIGGRVEFQRRDDCLARGGKPQ
jgi:hypothetical protein